MEFAWLRTSPQWQGFVQVRVSVWLGPEQWLCWQSEPLELPGNLQALLRRPLFCIVSDMPSSTLASITMHRA
jgi:hypothetical protein